MGGNVYKLLEVREVRSVIMAAINGPGWISTAGERPSYAARIKHKDNPTYTRDISKIYQGYIKDISRIYQGYIKDKSRI